MSLKLLLIENNKHEANKISALINSEFNELTIYQLSDSVICTEKVFLFSADIILFDIDYPSKNRNKNLEFITTNLAVKKTPVVVVLSSNIYEDIFANRIHHFIQKPYSDTYFISILKSAIYSAEVIKDMEQKEAEIEEKNKKIELQVNHDLKQREIIMKKNKEIMADIRYASRIQQAILPGLDYIRENTDEYFILHQPKSHVSGDFYWISKSNNQKIIAVGDCTGHGLSGALMHMLGSVYLNQIVTKGNYKSASDILEQLRDHIMESLNQTGESGEAQDGLDIALCVLDCENKLLQFAGANNPLYIIKNKELTEIKGDRMPVGIHINFDKPFTNHYVELDGNDQIYMFSDGYADQFGGAKGKKFRYKQFKELLINISDQPMNIQKEILNNTHDDWRGSIDQIDDILVFGIKIK